MKVLILGKGGREHTLAWKFSKSHRIAGLFISPGNAGTAELGENIPDVDICDPAAVVRVCREKDVNFVFVGPEAPLAAGIVDALAAEGISAFGPPKKSAVLESSKAFSKQFMGRHRIPTAKAKEFNNLKDFSAYLAKNKGPLVIKKNGLAEGKGVLESDDQETLYRFGENILRNDSVLVEEYLKGYEITLFALTDGKSYVLMPACSDFKKALDGDIGPNSGGMGAICPVPGIDSGMLNTIERTIIKPTFDGLVRDRLCYKGVLYFGLMITSQGPKLLEYNVRFGDPETQVVLPLLKGDFGDLCQTLVQEKLKDYTPAYSSCSALGIVIASGGYPGTYKTDKPVEPIPQFPEEDVLVFHSSTRINRDNRIVTGGGRCFTVVGLGENLLNANKKAYEAAAKVNFEGSFYRSDIGKRFFLE